MSELKRYHIWYDPREDNDPLDAMVEHCEGEYYRADEVDALLKHREQVYLRARQELIAHNAQLRNQLLRAQAIEEAEDE